MADRSFSMMKEMAFKTVTPAMRDRKTELEQLLQKNGMELRDDSRLAHNYIVNGGDVVLTAHELLCTNFLFQNTNYPSLCQEGLRFLANEMRQRYNLPWKQTWNIVREYGVPAMKFYALAESAVGMPYFDVLPPEAAQA